MARYSVNNYTVETLQFRKCSVLLFGIVLKSET